jgi:hypothetical protein
MAENSSEDGKLRRDNSGTIDEGIVGVSWIVESWSKDEVAELGLRNDVLKEVSDPPWYRVNDALKGDNAWRIDDCQ